MIRALSLFSGIGGLDLGWEVATGGHVTTQCEADPYRRSVLKRHWPETAIIPDVRMIGDIECDWIIGGFPCQPFSTAARGRQRADRDLWPEMRGVIRRLNPRGVFAENVSERAIDTAALDLCADGYSCAAGQTSSADVGAPHDRRRWWVLAYANPQSQSLGALDEEMAGLPETSGPWTRLQAARVLGMDDGATDGLDQQRRAAIGDSALPLQAAVALRLLHRELTK